MYRIDTHHHILPKIYIESLAKINITTAGGIPFPNWDPDKMMQLMDKYNIKFVPTDGVAIETSEFDSYLTQELKLQISHKTAENLFPRLQEKK